MNDGKKVYATGYFHHLSAIHAGWMNTIRRFGMLTNNQMLNSGIRCCSLPEPMEAQPRKLTSVELRPAIEDETNDG